MLFNSFEFLLFFPIVAILYYLITPKYRWVFLLVASYYFYMNWQPIYAILIFTSTLVTYLCALKIDSTPVQSRKKAYLTASLIINLGILFLFKYYNFFNDSIFGLLNDWGIRMTLPNFDLLLPVGISFYTFQAVGYTIDVYRGDIKSEKHFGIYALFVSFFPQLVAGPIERAVNLLPQFKETKIFNYQQAVQGIKLMIWGYFMKIVVADRLAIYVNSVYGAPEYHSAITLIIATIFFAFQIYCDFAGYSNIAIGCAKIMGFDLMTNFRRPYFAQSCAEFWSRWHISLSTWFKDYVYIPLGGNRVGTSKNYRNILITFLVSGLWHGANWTYVIWGGLNGLYQVIFKILGISPKRKKEGSRFNLVYIGNLLLTFILISFSWIFFRANSLSDAITVIERMVTAPGGLFIGEKSSFAYSLFAIIVLMLKDAYDEFYPDGNLFFTSKVRTIRYLSYSIIIVIILLLGVFDGGQFIYFQF
ncbi:MBOAT family O-acyltransferase [Zobellia barbeyronii]|uniref:MBOAT family protein n=1 Tax=Zobellia barbeyronii TaxID=2748009 RepID=A0ABS5W8L0_9FLAO|nr:MBOAT family O-acyltransferase [Zobellia barbeyronii]MBT2159766.1 MBOAT family protein [Zobellia barbeyronii]